MNSKLLLSYVKIQMSYFSYSKNMLYAYQIVTFYLKSKWFFFCYFYSNTMLCPCQLIISTIIIIVMYNRNYITYIITYIQGMLLQKYFISMINNFFSMDITRKIFYVDSKLYCFNKSYSKTMLCCWWILLLQWI